MFTRLTSKLRDALFLALVLALALLASACESSDASSHVDNATISSTSNAQFGKVLTDRNGMTLYFFDNDKPIKPQSSCTGACAMTWPIVPAANGATVGSGLDASKLGQTTRTDGQVQLTYNSWPLYRFSGDHAAGDTNGQGIMGIWHVAGAGGKPITEAVTQSSGPADSGY